MINCRNCFKKTAEPVKIKGHFLCKTCAQLDVIYLPAYTEFIDSSLRNSGRKSVEKVCTKCKVSKPKSAFYADKKNNSGLNSWCSACCKSKVRSYRDKKRKSA